MVLPSGEWPRHRNPPVAPAALSGSALSQRVPSCPAAGLRDKYRLPPPLVPLHRPSHSQLQIHAKAPNTGAGFHPCPPWAAPAGAFSQSATGAGDPTLPRHVHCSCSLDLGHGDFVFLEGFQDKHWHICFFFIIFFFYFNWADVDPGVCL